MTDYPELPHCISTVFPGALIIAITRLNPKIRYHDFLARMPLVETATKTRVKRLEPALANSALGARVGRFSKEAGCPLWEGREEGALFRQYVKQIARRSGCAPNSTERLKWGNRQKERYERWKEARKGVRQD